VKINIKVKPNSKQEKVEKISDSEFILWVRAPAKEGRANAAAVKLLSVYLDLPKSRINIAQGNNSKNKVVELL
jgi:uncharacterized protein YggU (UPF0235/DUF167 family)